MQRLTMNMPDELMKRVDEYAEKNYVNRTSAVCVLLSKALQSDDYLNSIIKMGSVLDNVGADTQNSEK